MVINRLSGWIFRLIRENAGFSRRRFAAELRKVKQPGCQFIASDSGLKLLERRSSVPDCYIVELQRIVTMPVFAKWVRILKQKYPEEIEIE